MWVNNISTYCSIVGIARKTSASFSSGLSLKDSTCSETDGTWGENLKCASTDTVVGKICGSGRDKDCLGASHKVGSPTCVG